MNDRFGMDSATPAAAPYAQVPLQILHGSGAFLYASANCFVIHCFADANKHSDKRNETQSHVNTVRQKLIKKCAFSGQIPEIQRPNR